MEVWDFLHNHEVPILNIKVADSALNCLKVVQCPPCNHQIFYQSTTTGRSTSPGGWCAWARLTGPPP